VVLGEPVREVVERVEQWHRQLFEMTGDHALTLRAVSNQKEEVLFPFIRRPEERPRLLPLSIRGHESREGERSGSRIPLHRGPKHLTPSAVFDLVLWRRRVTF
jgi:hypothetical protein